MPVDYKKIARENEQKYGTEIDNYGPALLADRYSDPAHFVYELLQNAEDALSERKESAERFALPKAANFILFKDRLEFRHFGIPFAENHIRAICDIARSSKQKTPAAIGRFGIGFKSVYAFTRSPEIHSYSESFAIESMVRPVAVPPKQTAEGETLFVLPFDRAETPASKCYDIIAERLCKLGPRTLLFLQHLDSIDWKIEGGECGRYRRESKQKAEDVTHVTLVGEEQSKARIEEEHWLVFSRRVTSDNGASCIVQIGYQWQQPTGKRRDQIVPTTDSPLCVYFATDLQTNLGFLVQGPFHLTQNRDNVRRDDKWNSTLAKEIGKLTADSLFRLKELNLVSLSALAAMPLEKEPFETETGKLFMPVFDAVLQALKKHPLVPGLGDRWVSGNGGILVRGRELTELFTSDQIQTLFGWRELRDWISPDISPDKAPSRKLHNYIHEALGVRELDAETVCSQLDEQFLTERDVAWFVRFYRFLLKHESLWSGYGGLRHKPIIRLADGNNVLPFDDDGLANAFLPTECGSESKIIHPELAKGDALKFLMKLGIRERDAVAEVLDDILPQYESGEEPVERKHERNLRRIARALGQKESQDHSILVDKLKNTAFLRATNAKTGKQSLQAPSALLYFQSARLRDYFEGQADAWFLAEPAGSKSDKTIHRLAELGVADKPSILTEWEGQEAVEARHQRKIESHGRLKSLTDYNFHGLDNLLNRIRKFSKTSPKVARRLSKLLWSFLCQIAGDDEVSLEGCLKWKRYSPKRVEEETFDAYFVECLREATWLPDRKGMFRKPGEMQARDLPPGFERCSKLCIAMQFQTPLSERLRGAGVAPKFAKVLELAQADPEFAEQFLRSYRKQGFVQPSSINADTEFVEAKRSDRMSCPESGEDPMNQNGSTPMREVEPMGMPSPQSAQADPDLVSPEARHVKPNGDNSPRTNHLQTRVRVVAGVGCESTTESQEGADWRLRIDRAGIVAVKAFEAQAGRSVTELRHNHPGYDLESWTKRDEILRYIEVKSTGSDWNGVLLSAMQFRKAQELGGLYWLYVVENANLPTAKVFPIQNPAGLSEKFIFDAGWKDIACAQRLSLGNGSMPEDVLKSSCWDGL